MFNSGARTFPSWARWILLLPVVMVGSLLYWTLAIGLGAQSLMIAGALSYVPQPVEVTGAGGSVSGEPAAPTADIVDGMGGTILIHLQESAEPEDVNDNPGAGDTSAADDGPSAL